jgi:hypothetical protein
MPFGISNQALPVLGRVGIRLSVRADPLPISNRVPWDRWAEHASPLTMEWLVPQFRHTASHMASGTPALCSFHVKVGHNKQRKTQGSCRSFACSPSRRAPGSRNIMAEQHRQYKKAPITEANIDQRLRELYEKFEPHCAILVSLAQRVDDLRSWGADWEEYDAAPPTPATVDHAHQWIKDLYLDVLTSGRTWVDPLITASEDGEAMFEWQRRGRRLTVRVTETEVTSSKIWGTRPNFQFEDGTADTAQKRQSLWAWLGG